MSTRTENDSMGPIEVKADALWSAQTQRAMHFFGDGLAGEGERMPIKLVHAIARIKQAAAAANSSLGRLDDQRAERIKAAAAQVVAGEHDDQFPLPIWISGSGTQSNMNVNEVIASIAKQEVGSVKRKRDDEVVVAVHPNDHVNASQSTNDVFPSAIHVATALEIHNSVLPELDGMVKLVQSKAEEWANIVKCGRTHMMDAVPMTLGQEVSGWAHSLQAARDALAAALDELYSLPLGGTAVGTGINTPAGYDQCVCSELAALSGLPFRVAENKFSRMGGHEALLQAMSALKRLAVVLLRVADDVRLLGSGPRTGLGELSLPANEPGSSIMPGKVNPTQCEALSMRAIQVIGLEAAVTVACGSGFLQMNVYKPLIGANLLSATELLAQGMRRFCAYCLIGAVPNHDAISMHVSKVQLSMISCSVATSRGLGLGIGQRPAPGRDGGLMYKDGLPPPPPARPLFSPFFVLLFSTHCTRLHIAPILTPSVSHRAQSLMLVTALNPVIGYDKAAAIAKHAHKEGSTLREAALALGHLDAETFDKVIDAKAMATPP